MAGNNGACPRLKSPRISGKLSVASDSDASGCRGWLLHTTEVVTSSFYGREMSVLRVLPESAVKYLWEYIDAHALVDVCML